MRRFLFQVVVFLTAVNPGFCFTQADEKRLPINIISFILDGSSVAHTYHPDDPKVNSNSMSLSWGETGGKSELTKKVYSMWTVEEGSPGEPVVTVEPKPFNYYMLKPFEIKQSAQTDGIKSEAEVEVHMMADDAGVVIEGHQKINITPPNNGTLAESSTWVNFTVSVQEEATVSISGCDIFEKEYFKSVFDFQDNGQDCGFKVTKEHIEMAPKTFGVVEGLKELLEGNPLLDEALERDILALQETFEGSRELKGGETMRRYSGVHLLFKAELKGKAAFILGYPNNSSKGVNSTKPFKITIIKACDTDTPIVNVSSGNKPGPFKKNYQECTRNIVNAVNGKFPGLVKIGGPVERCQYPSARFSEKEWYKQTGGTCKAKDFEGKNKQPKYDSEPDHNTSQCSDKGSIWNMEEIYIKTNKTCKEGAIDYKLSDHIGGYAVDLFVSLKPKKAPTGCVLEAGDHIAEWARTNGNDYGIENIIWNKKTASPPGNWRDYKKAEPKPAKDGKKAKKGKPHYDHIHIDCKNKVGP